MNRVENRREAERGAHLGVIEWRRWLNEPNMVVEM
jgi:hypothetical protein